MSDGHPGIDYPEDIGGYKKDALVPKLWKEIDRLRAELTDVRLALESRDQDIADLWARVKRLRQSLREITQAEWSASGSTGGHLPETPFQFEQRIHRIAAAALASQDALKEET